MLDNKGACGLMGLDVWCRVFWSNIVWSSWAIICYRFSNLCRNMKLQLEAKDNVFCSLRRCNIFYAMVIQT
jgi:hypothetical protein